MTNEQQKREGVRSGREAAEGAIKLGYLAWLGRQINQCRQLASRYPYAAGYVIGATDVLKASKG